MIGYSQGGLIARGMLETYGTEHNVRTFVSLSSPQGGQYGGKYFNITYKTLILVYKTICFKYNLYIYIYH